MLNDSRAFSGFSVDDLAAAKEFYGQRLGLEVSETNGMLTLHLAGGRDTIIYPKPDHVPATYTTLNFPVADIEATVDWLQTRGVAITQYPFTDPRGINRRGGPLVAWFADPAGNILSVLEDPAR